MANQVCNISKGHVNEYVNRVVANDPSTAGLIVVLLTVNVADDALRGFDDLAALLADAGNTEAVFTNYARQVLTDVSNAPSISVDDTNDWKQADFPDLTITAAGGGTNETLTKAIVCYAPDTGGADSTIIPMTHHDFAVTTNGNDLIIQVDPNGFYRAA